MSPNKIKKIREAVLQLQESGGRNVRYPEYIKKSVLEILRGGMSLANVSRLTGLRTPALSKWLRKSEGEFQKINVASVPVSAEECTVAIGVILPSGVRIECHSCNQLKEILEYLR